MYRNLDATKIVDTASALRDRIGERFPDSGLHRLSQELLVVCGEAAAISEWLARPNRWLRAAVGLALAVLLAALVGVLLTSMQVQGGFANLSDLFQGLEALVNDVVFLCIGTFFLLSWERRLKRRRALHALHNLRSMAHIIDMHQLTKDPGRLLVPGADTAATPRRMTSPFELTRYLDYCSELLAVISKVGALYVQRFQDPATMATVDQLETLTAGLSRKIWQKIMILDRVAAAPPVGQPDSSPDSPG